MRVLLVMLVVGCVQRTTGLPGDPGDPPPLSHGCSDDSQCVDSFVCSHTNQCQPLSKLREVHVNWTVGGMPANRTTCNPLPALEIEFVDTAALVDSHFGFSPLACDEGKFSIDRLPIGFTEVRIGAQKLGWKSGTIDAATGEAALDLTF